MLQHLRQSKHELTHEEVQKMIRQELDSRNNEKQRCSPDIDRQGKISYRKFFSLIFSFASTI